MSIVVPSICDAGESAAMLGAKMATLAQPMGFTFNPYRAPSVEHWNFVSGIVEYHFNGYLPIRGEESRWVRP